MNDIQQLSVTELQQRLASINDILLLDVREDNEVALCTLPDYVHIPMNLIPLRHNELPDNRTIVVYCHHGIRSLQVAMYLAHIGFEQVINLKGGIDAWAREIDTHMTRY